MEDLRSTTRQTRAAIEASMFCDSRIVLSREQKRELSRAIADDDATCLTLDQIELLVMGTDEGGVPEELAKRFPHVHQTLNKFYE